MKAKSRIPQQTVIEETLQRVYGHALSHPFGDVIDVEATAAQLGFPVTDVHAAVAELTDMGLLRDRPGRGLVAVAPDEAVSRVLGPLEFELRTRRVQIEETRARLQSFTPLFEASRGVGGQPRQVEIIENLDDVRTAITELSATCTSEILTAQPGGGRREDVLVEAAPRDYETLRRGVEMRILYQHTARSSRGTHSYVEQVTRLGAEVRTLDDQFMRFLVFDRERALIATPGNPAGAALVRDPNVVAFLVEAYERLWLSAEPFVVEADAQPEIADALKEAIVRLLTTGLTDEAVARRLGMSVRTCRRHVAELMASLNAESRFQAGYLLALQEQSESE
ncbi:LuxR C-terminal-related transcriptional regulator [Streptomyces sp. LUP30]|uniref:LuxR C-terminal-related transcriptional regulator n=1 Tax=Streptomyces sp. LUP30 TaxID=1890285 RepID=UPI000851E1C1|nr:LuxR C-terminal-related transcriptional regulator [Streptomyces sp. LUP30]